MLTILNLFMEKSVEIISEKLRNRIKLNFNEKFNLLFLSLIDIEIFAQISLITPLPFM